MDRNDFVSRFKDIFEHSSWIAERTYDLGLGFAYDSAENLWSAMCRVFRAASEQEKMQVITAHPDLAGKLAAAKKLTESSTLEQASAGLDCLTDEERDQFTQLNESYKQKFGFPFIIAVRDHNKASILDAFKQRLNHDKAQEVARACYEIERIALHRLQASIA